MSETNTNLFDDLSDVTQAEVMEAKRRSLLDKGYYSAAITGITPKVASSGQAMLIVNYAPCSSPGNPKTQSFKHKLTHFFMLPWLKDKEALRNKLAFAGDSDPATISDEEVEDAWEAKKARALNTFIGDVRTLLGSEKDIVPLRKELVQAGRAADYEVANVMALNCAKEAVQAIANGNVNLEGHTRVLYVTQGVYNGEPVNNISRVSEDLPPGRDYTPFAF